MDIDVNKVARRELMKEWPAAEKLRRLGDMCERERDDLAKQLCAHKIDTNVVRVNQMLSKI